MENRKNILTVERSLENLIARHKKWMGEVLVESAVADQACRYIESDFVEMAKYASALEKWEPSQAYDLSGVKRLFPANNNDRRVNLRETGVKLRYQGIVRGICDAVEEMYHNK